MSLCRGNNVLVSMFTRNLNRAIEKNARHMSQTSQRRRVQPRSYVRTLRARGIARPMREFPALRFAAECLDRMKDSAAREFAEKLIRERLQELVSAVQAATPAVTQEEERRIGRKWDEHRGTSCWFGGAGY